MWRGQAPDELHRVADGLLANMPILFVPVGAGAIVYLDLFQRHWLAVAVGVVAGTIVTLAISGMSACVLLGRKSSHKQRHRVYGGS